MEIIASRTMFFKLENHTESLILNRSKQATGEKLHENTETQKNRKSNESSVNSYRKQLQGNQKIPGTNKTDRSEHDIHTYLYIHTYIHICI